MEMISREELVSVKRVVKKRKRRSNTDDDDPLLLWSDLPNDLLETIKKRLSYHDQCKLSIVCKSWSCIEEQKRNIIPPLQQMPWLLVFDDETSKLIDPNNKKTYTIDTKTIKEKMNISHFMSTTFHESKCGWLLLSCLPATNKSFRIPAKSFFLYSPFLNKNDNFIKLPILKVGMISLATFISNPFDDDDFTVIALNTTLHENAILVNTYRTRGQDESWNSRVFKCELFSLRDVSCWMYSQRIFYYTTRSGKMGTFDLTREDWNDLPSPQITNLAPYGPYVTFYMVKSNDKELFLIGEDNFSIGNRNYSRNRICRLDLLSMIWEISTSIGDNRVMFVGDGYNCVLNSSVLKSNGVRLRNGVSDTIYYCLGKNLTYVTIDEYPDEGYFGSQEYFGRQHCSRLYGRIARKGGRKLLIDPPHSSLIHHHH